MANTKGMNPLVEAALGEMQENYAYILGIDELADKLEVSKCHLIRVFTEIMGISPGKYLSGVRVENAMLLLLNADLSLEMVAGMCGFSCANYMSKVFRKYTGMSPGRYRRSRANTGAHYVDQQIYL